MARHKGRQWYVSDIGGELEAFDAEDVLHLRGTCWDNQEAPELVKQARHDFGLQLAARKFTSSFFANGAHLGGVLQVPPNYKKTSRDKIEKALNERGGVSKGKAFRSIVLRDNYRFYPTSVDPDKAKLIDVDEAQVRHVARWFRMHPSRLGAGDTNSYATLEQAKQDYHDTTLGYWLIRNQGQCNAKLLRPSERRAGYCIRYRVNALLWADAKTRNEIAVSGINAGRFSADETREWDGMNPRPDGEGGKFLQPLNMTVAGDPPKDNQRALRELVTRDVTRVVRRVRTHAERAAKNERKWVEWCSSYVDDEAACVAMLEDTVGVCGTSRRGAALVIVQHLHRQLADLTKCDDVAATFDRLENELPLDAHSTLNISPETEPD